MIKRKIIFSIIAFIIIEGLSILNIELSHKKELDLYYSVQTEGLELNQKAAQNAYLLMTENVFNHLISNEKILQIFSQANTDDSLRRSEMRIRLYDELAHAFGYLKSSEINHLHFYLPNNKSFLRFHRSDKFDDDLSLTRYSVKLVNETKQKQIGFEIGTNHSAFRYVFPLFYKNEYIGSVETGFSFKSIMDQLKVHQNIVYGFMLKKEFVSKTNAKYVQNLLSENYVEEEQFLHYLEDSLNILKRIDKSISNEIASQVAENKNFTVSCKIDGNYYLVSFVSINSIEGKPVAYLFSYKEDNVITEYKRQYYIVHISSFISFFLLILLFYLISRKTGRIKEKDEDYKALINANTDIVFIVSRENELLYLNKQVESTLGYKPESLVGETFTQFIVQSEIPILLEKVKGLFSERQTSHFYTQIIHKSGRFIDAEINLRVIKYNRKLVGVCTLKDITERKKSELALKTSDERYKEVEKIAQLGHWDFDIISNKLYWSDQIYRIFDIEPQEFGGTYEAFLGEIHPDDRERVNLSYRSSLANKLPYEVEHRILLKNGELRHVVEKCRTEYDKLGRAVRSIGMVIDITERKNAEQALIESEKKFSEIFKNSPIAFSLSTVSDGRFFEINDSFTTIFGFTELEVKGKTSADLNIWLNSENRSEGVELLRKDGFVRNLEVQIRTKSGEIKDVLLSGLIIEISGKSMLASHFMDITAKKNVELALKESEETLRFIFENSPNLYYSHSPNHVLNYVSPQVFKL
ncbi:MAG: PAS domain S-box protein, partial [Bacteroidales bacterium]|nr:PAS domain S-box protein [Bacteroidales bacterium]